MINYGVNVLLLFFNPKLRLFLKTRLYTYVVLLHNAYRIGGNANIPYKLCSTTHDYNVYTVTTIKTPGIFNQ